MIKHNGLQPGTLMPLTSNLAPKERKARVMRSIGSSCKAVKNKGQSKRHLPSYIDSKFQIHNYQFTVQQKFLKPNLLNNITWINEAQIYILHVRNVGQQKKFAYLMSLLFKRFVENKLLQNSDLWRRNSSSLWHTPYFL